MEGTTNLQKQSGRSAGNEKPYYRSPHGNHIFVSFVYPEKNPQGYVSEIANALHYVGLFHGLNAEKGHIQAIID